MTEMNEIAPLLFKKLLVAKKREIIFTQHAKQRAAQRFMAKEVLENDLFRAEPVKAFEQDSEDHNERKFDVYFLQKTGIFHRYVLCLNNAVRIITMMRTNKQLQKWVSGGLR